MTARRATWVELSSSWSRLAAAAVLAAVLGVSAGCGAAGSPGQPGAVGTTSQTSSTVGPTPSSSSAPTPSTSARDGAGQAAVPVPGTVTASVPKDKRPVRVLIPRIGVDSTLVDLGISEDGTLEVPRDYQRAGWLASGPAPGQRGPAVIAGHVDSKGGPAVFYRLRDLHVGDPVAVVLADGSRVRFEVDDVQQYAKNAFPTNEVYGPVPGPVLRLITCGGSFDHDSGHYRDNVVVYAS